MRSFAIIPAAGQSRRMGAPKLLLPWGETTVIARTLEAWSASGVNEIVLVARPGDHQLAAATRGFRVHLVLPSIDPPEMKDSVLLGLDYVRTNFRPIAADVWLLAPADMPQLSKVAIDRILAAHRPELADILVPLVHGRRGHPVLFPWALADEVTKLKDNEGLNAIVLRHGSRGVSCDDEGLLNDLDTPEDFRRLRP